MVLGREKSQGVKVEIRRLRRGEIMETVEIAAPLIKLIYPRGAIPQRLEARRRIVAGARRRRELPLRYRRDCHFGSNRVQLRFKAAMIFVM